MKLLLNFQVKGFGSTCYESAVPQQEEDEGFEMPPVMRSTRRNPVSPVKDCGISSGGREWK